LGANVSGKTVKRHLKEVNTWNPCNVKRIPRKKVTCKICNESFLTRSIGKYCTVCIPNKKAKCLWQTYKITLKQFELMWNNQQGRCAICEIDLLTLPQKQVHVDHDHESNQVRGVLCAKCNNGLGFIERPGFLKKAMTYLER